jgi:uncharacterized protein (DUF1684 family)
MSEFDADAWAAQLRQHRREKDDFFAQHQQSPIPPEHRDSFTALNYYDPDPTYRVEAAIDRSEDPKSVDLEMTTGRTMTYRRVATLTFDLDGERTLAAYHRDGSEELFVPVADPTNGDTTYGKGRYLDLQVEPTDLVDHDRLMLDFNLLYAPFCAYSETFDCPLPTDENHLDVRVEAGERSWEP